MAAISTYLNLSSAGDTARELHHLVMASKLDKSHALHLATKLGINHPTLVGLTKLKKSESIDWRAAEFLITCAKAAHQLSAKGLSDAQIGVWLQSSCPALKQKVPMDLLQTYPGTEYVMTAISRM